jgi:hypothetical protein
MCSPLVIILMGARIFTIPFFLIIFLTFYVHRAFQMNFIFCKMARFIPEYKYVENIIIC